MSTAVPTGPSPRPLRDRSEPASRQRWFAHIPRSRVHPMHAMLSFSRFIFACQHVHQRSTAELVLVQKFLLNFDKPHILRFWPSNFLGRPV